MKHNSLIGSFIDNSEFIATLLKYLNKGVIKVKKKYFIYLLVYYNLYFFNIIIYILIKYNFIKNNYIILF